MSDVLNKIEQLVNTGTQLVPLGGFEFSGYNARLQNKYLEWRKASLEFLEQVGPIGFPYKNKILADQNGGYFFQASAQLILNGMKELLEKLKASPDLASSPQAVAAAPAAAAAPVGTDQPGATRVLRPPPKPAQAASAAPAQQAPPPPTAGATKVYIIGESGDPLREQLSQFIKELGLEEVSLNRERGKMLALDKLQENPEVRYAFFVLNSDDLSYAMFEIGHYVGKLGSNHVCVLHMSDVSFPKGVPGVAIRPIVVKLEEVSFSVMKDLKAAGYRISI
ncbi:MAG TPA: TIR domain-containing protein [Bacteroidota bacterium]|nr:TIR domain-containing protein [Bacteroidota bacterium]